MGVMQQMINSKAMQTLLNNKDLLRSAEGALRSMENVPGGFETVKSTFNKLERPYTEALEMAKVKLEEEGVPAEYPELSYDPNAMAAMFQDPNMVQLMASLFTAKENKR